MKPTLIITMGATGSGKSKLAKEVLKFLNISNPKYYLIDDYVEKDPSYTRKIKKFSKGKSVYSKMKKPSKKTMKFFEKSYFYSRKKGCKQKLKKKSTPKKLCIDLDKGGCDRLMDIDLNNSLIKGDNIVFETKGEYYPKWLIKSSIKCNKYNIVIAAIKVSLNNLIKRNIGRSLTSMKSFMSKQSLNAPRLPDTSIDSLKQQKKKLNKTLTGITKNGCVKKSDTKFNHKFCSKFKIDRLLVYDNNKNLKLIYDTN